MTPARSAALLLLLPGSPSAFCAQRTQAPTLSEILERLQAHLDHNDAALPSLFCDEHVISSETEPRTRDQTSVIDSVFRLRRVSSAGHATAFVESREIKSIDGGPADSKRMDGPALLSGLFEGGLAVVSLDQAACMTYSLQPVDRKHPADPYVVRFATALTRWNSAHCFLQEKSKGRVFIDRASMQVTRLEITTPHHVAVAGGDDTPRIVGKRELMVDYAPVLLGSERFWMPSAITMHVTSNGFRLIRWSFEAAYRDYHRMEVTSRILSAGVPPAQ